MLRPLTGAAEAACQDAAEAGLPQRAVLSALIAACVPELDDAEALSVGAREAMALSIRASAFEGPMRARLRCDACGEELDLAIDPRALLHAPAAPMGALEIGGLRFACRPVTAADQAAVAGIAEEEDAARTLLARCVTPEAGCEIATLSHDLLQALAAHLLALDPLAETLLASDCPACGAAVQGSLDAGAFLVEEVLRRAPATAREVLVIARATGWAEDAILAMPQRRRRRYAALLGDGA
jgi:hypothetical protein